MNKWQNGGIRGTGKFGRGQNMENLASHVRKIDFNPISDAK